MLKPLIVTFKDVGRFFLIWVFRFLSIYPLFFKETAAILYFCHFPYNIRFLLNIAVILLHVHYFDAESSEKNQLLQAKCTKIHILKKTDGGHFVFVSHQNCVKFKSTHNI